MGDWIIWSIITTEYGYKPKRIGLWVSLEGDGICLPERYYLCTLIDFSIPVLLCFYPGLATAHLMGEIWTQGLSCVLCYTPLLIVKLVKFCIVLRSKNLHGCWKVYEPNCAGLCSCFCFVKEGCMHGFWEQKEINSYNWYHRMLREKVIFPLFNEEFSPIPHANRPGGVVESVLKLQISRTAELFLYCSLEEICPAIWFSCSHFTLALEVFQETWSVSSFCGCWRWQL